MDCPMKRLSNADLFSSSAGSKDTAPGVPGNACRTPRGKVENGARSGEFLAAVLGLHQDADLMAGPAHGLHRGAEAKADEIAGERSLHDEQQLSVAAGKAEGTVALELIFGLQAAEKGMNADALGDGAMKSLYVLQAP